jgi:hypothetical protein
MTNHRYLIFCLVCFIPLASCNQPNAQWKGTIEEVDGVNLVKNPEKPLYGDVIFVLDEVLNIGNEADDNFLFIRVTDLDIDSEEKIYVLDAGNFRLQIFDAEGGFVRSVGQKGQGPGEFVGLPFRFFLKNDNIFIQEYRKMNVFDTGGDFVRSYPLDTYIVEFAIAEEGCLIGYADINQRETAVRGIIKMNSEGQTIKTYAEYTDLGIKIIVAENMTYTLSPNHSYTPILNFAPLGENMYIYGYASDYSLNLIDGNGNPLLRFQRQESPQPIYQKEKDYFINQAIKSLERSRIKLPKSKVQETLYFNKHRAFFDKIIIDDLQRIYIRRIQPVLDTKVKVEFDIFNKNGYYLYRTELPFSPEIIKNGCLYDVQTDEETGMIRIVKFEVSNWDQIKEGILL